MFSQCMALISTVPAFLSYIRSLFSYSASTRLPSSTKVALSPRQLSSRCLIYLPDFYVHLAGFSNQVYLPQDVLSSPSFHLTEHPTTAHHPRSTTRAFSAASVACSLPAPLVSADDVPPEDPLPLPLPALFSLGCVPPLAGGQPGAGVYPGGGA